jgi:GAF domain-containing protein
MEIGTEEASRLATLIEYDILDSEAEEPFDRLAEIAAVLFQVPIAAVSLVDGYRQWFKSRVGWAVDEWPRKGGFCEHTIQGDAVLVVADAAKDRRFSTNPLVTKAPSIRFYAGAPLLTAGGQALGTICIMDRRARRQLSPREKRMLQHLAAMVMEQIEIRRHVRAAKSTVQRAVRLAGAKRADVKLVQAECQKALQSLRAVQAAPRIARKRARLITPDEATPRRRSRVGVSGAGANGAGATGAGANGAAATRRAERRRRARTT